MFTYLFITGILVISMRLQSLDIGRQGLTKSEYDYRLMVLPSTAIYPSVGPSPQATNSSQGLSTMHCKNQERWVIQHS